MAISRAQAQKELVPGLNKLFGLEYAKYPDEHMQIYETENSDRTFEEELKLSGFGYAQTKNEGQGVTYDNAQESFTARYTHETITLGFAITEEAVEDNLYDSLSARYTKALAKSMADTKQVKAVVPLNLGFTTYLSGDGVALFSASHPTVYGGVNANRPSVGVDLNETSVENMWIQIAGWTDERGLLIAAKPQKLIIPTQLAFTAERLLKTTQRIATADNDISAMVSMGVFPGGYTINHRLTDTNAWFVKTDVPNGMKMFVRTPLKTQNEGDFDTGNFKYKARERYSFGVTDPLNMWGSPGST
jgi:hypothetical protein